MIHYVYKITNITPINEKQFYIGVHSTDNKIPLEDGYMGSSKYLSSEIKNQGIDSFDKTILSTWNTRKLAEKEEKRLHKLFDVRNNNSYFNKHNASDENTIGYDRVVALDKNNMIVWLTKSEFQSTDDYNGINKGLVWTFDKQAKVWCWVSKNEYHTNKICYDMPTNNNVAAIDIVTNTNVRISKELFDKTDRYIGVSTNKVVVLNIETNKVEQITKALFDSQPTLYISVSAGKITANDTLTNKNVYITIEEFYASDRYKTASTKMVSCIDTLDGITKQVSKKDFDMNLNYVGVNTKCIYIYDNNKKFVKMSDYNFRTFCKDNGYPYTAFYKSYSTKIPVYNNVGPNYKMLVTNGLLKYKDWMISSIPLY